MLTICFFVICGKSRTRIIVGNRDKLLGLPGKPLGGSDPDRLAHSCIPTIGHVVKQCEYPELITSGDGSWEGKPADFSVFLLPSTFVDVPMISPYRWIDLDLSKDPDPLFDGSVVMYINYLKKRLIIQQNGTLKIAV